MPKHVIVIAYDEGENPHLWSLQEAGGRFLCRIWELTPERAADIAATRGPFAMAEPPTTEAELETNEQVYAFFAGPIDTVRSSFADHIIEKLAESSERQLY